MTDSNSPAIHLSDLSLSFGSVDVLKQVNLRVAYGQHVALTGRSGSGKTSLLAIIGGLLQASSGRAETLGLVVSDSDEDALAELRRRAIGVVFQHFHLLETMTALENVALPLELSGRTDAEETARQMLDAVGLSDRISHFPAQLSGGEQQRVAIARAFAPRPPLLLADEPTGNLDDETSETILNMLFAMGREQQTTILFVTHNTAILERFDEVLTMHKGGVQKRHPTSANN